MQDIFIHLIYESVYAVIRNAAGLLFDAHITKQRVLSQIIALLKFIVLLLKLFSKRNITLNSF